MTRQGREVSPSAGILDSQSIKAPHTRKRGFDAGKKIVGRMRHIAMDTDGRLLLVNLTTADISDSAGAQMILDALRYRSSPRHGTGPPPLSAIHSARASPSNF